MRAANINKEGQAKQKCVSKNRVTGEPCAAWAIQGGTVCVVHGGTLPVVKNKAMIRYEVSQWTIGDNTEDPGEVLLRLVTQSYRRVALYASILKRLYEHSELVGDDSEIPRLEGGVQALIGGVYASTPEGDLYKTSEQIRGMVTLEANERKLCADFATKAIAAGLAERQVRIAERQSQVIVEAISAALDAIGITGEQRIIAQSAAADKLELVA